MGQLSKNALDVAISGQWLTEQRVYALIQSLVLITKPVFNLTKPPVRLVRTWAHEGESWASLLRRCMVLAQSLLCSISLPLYSSVPCGHGTEMRASSLVLHITLWLQFVIFHTRWSLLWNEMSFPKMKHHKSSVINLLVRLLQLSPVEDIWTADWLMPAVGLKHGALSLITNPTVSLSLGF